ncbi:MAG: hypothetical protein JW995_07695 [Melioribacteraceae bacterium]|nr:hypothetical protein [Melioribacteraceae bacterium]
MKYAFTIVTYFLLLPQFNSSAQILPGAKEISISHSGIATSNDVFAIFTNPAGLAQPEDIAAGIYYSPNPFGMSELSTIYCSALFPFGFANLGVGYMLYGFKLYKKNILSLSFSGRPFNKLLAGITANYNSISIHNYGTAGTVTLRAGLLYLINNYLRFGFSVDNITRESFGDYGAQLPSALTSGFTFILDDILRLSTAIYSELNSNTAVSIGIDYEIIKWFSFRFGFMDEPVSFSSGFGLNYSSFEFNYALFTHRSLGITHQFDTIIHFGSNNSISVKTNDHYNIDR